MGGALLKKWGVAAAAVGGLGLFMLMARPGHLPHGALWGAGLLALTLAGLLRALGLLSPAAAARPWQQTPLGPLPGEPAWRAPLPALAAGLLLLALLTPLLGADLVSVPILLALGLLLPAALRRPGLLLFVVVSALYLPLLGSFGLWDPWETHYGEVAREMLARDDWISLWWAQDGWFWSKPIMVFWVEALGWSASGIDFRPDSAFQHTEWALRLPHYAMGMAALASVYLTVARIFSPRAGLLAGLVLATTPYYGFIARQAVTDMPLVANLTVAVMCLLLAFHDSGEREARSYRFGPFGLSLRTAVVGLLLAVALPQVLYLLSRNVTLVDGYLFAWHRDEFMSGSGGNAGVPGNKAALRGVPALGALYFQPAAQALFWALGTAVSVWLVGRERRLRALWMYAFYVFCGLSFMGKGLPGIALPGLVALMALLSTQRWSLLMHGHLRVGQGILLVSVTSLPWFVAMYARHGSRFTNRLLIHDHINRLTRGVHGDKGSIQYFIEQLGYGMFPWVALVPPALALAFARRPSLPAAGPDSPPGPAEPCAQARAEAASLVGLWFIATFTLFSAMTTKFHHYIFPAVPPLAILIGLLLDRMLGRATPPASLRARAGWLLLLLGAWPAVLGAAGFFGDPRGVVPAGVTDPAVGDWVLQHGWPPALCGALLALSAGLLWAGARAAGIPGGGDSRPAGRNSDAGVDPASTVSAALGAGLLCGVALLAFVGRDLSWDTGVKPEGPERLIQLFVYNYKRDYPAHLDYRPILAGFGVVAGVLGVLLAAPRLRARLTPALVGLSLGFGVWLLDVYMIDLTPHWTQGHLVQRYYNQRSGPEQPLVAWQMNWKGENYYTGNRVSVFQALNNKEVTAWIDDNQGVQAYFLLEHKRLKRFRRLLKKRHVTTLSTRRDCNKFVLVRAVL